VNYLQNTKQILFDMKHFIHYLATGALLLAGWLVFQSQSPPRTAPGVLRAKAFELVDDKGTVRASLQSYPDGNTVLRLFSENGEIRVKIGASGDGSGIVLLDAQTNPGLHAVAMGDKASITLCGGGERKRVIGCE
jgi:hypothetical protein